MNKHWYPRLEKQEEKKEGLASKALTVVLTIIVVVLLLGLIVGAFGVLTQSGEIYDDPASWSERQELRGR